MADVAITASMAFDDIAFNQQVRKLDTTMAKEVNRVRAAAAEAGFGKDTLRQISLLGDKLKEKTVSGMEAAMRKGHTVRMGDIERETQAQLKATLMGYQREAKARKKMTDEIADRQEKGAAERGQAFAESVGSGIKNLTGGGIGGFIGAMGAGAKGAGSRFTEMGAGLQRKGAARSAMGKGGSGETMKMMGKAMGTMGTAASSLAAAAGTIAATVGALGAVVALLMKAWSQATELNKAILDGASAMDVAAASGGDLYKSLETIKYAANDVGFNLREGVNAEEFIKVINTFQEAGITFKELSEYTEDASNQVAAYKAAVKSATVWARAFGMSQEEISTNMADYMQELSYSLEDVNQRFAAVSKVAQMSGFGTKRFFSMILQATSGMAMYNVRMEEASGLLTRLGKILGTKMGGEFFQDLAGGFIEESAGEKVKRIIMTGRGETTRILSDEAARRSKDFVTKLNDNQKTMIADILGLNEVDLKKGKIAGGDIASAINALSADKQTMLLGKLNAQNADLGRNFNNLLDSTRGMSGDMGDMMIAMNNLGPGGVLTMKLTQAENMLGDISGWERDQLFAAEGMLGLSQKQIFELRQLDKSSEASFKYLQGDEARQERLNAVLSGTFEEYQVRMLTEMGGYIDLNGKIVAASLDATGKRIVEDSEIPLESAKDLLAASADMMALIEEPDEQIKLARQVAVHTMTLGDIMKNTIGAWLQKIWENTQFYLGWFKKDMGSPLSKEQLAMQQETIIAINQERQDLTNKLTDLNTRIDEADQRGDKEAVKQLQQEAERVKIQRDSLMWQQQEVEAIKEAKEGTFTSIEEFRRDAVSGGPVSSSMFGKGIVGGGYEVGYTGLKGEEATRLEKELDSRSALLTEEQQSIYGKLTIEKGGKAEARAKEMVEGVGGLWKNMDEETKLLLKQKAALELMVKATENPQALLTAMDRSKAVQEAQVTKTGKVVDLLEEQGKRRGLEHFAKEAGVGGLGIVPHSQPWYDEVAKAAKAQGGTLYDELSGQYPELKDFLLRIPSTGGRAEAFSIDPGDVVSGVKPGGPLAGGMGGGGIVNIYVYGGDETKVLATLRRGLEAARLV